MTKKPQGKTSSNRYSSTWLREYHDAERHGAVTQTTPRTMTLRQTPAQLATLEAETRVYAECLRHTADDQYVKGAERIATAAQAALTEVTQ